MNLIITIILALLLTPVAADCRMNVGVLGGGAVAAAAPSGQAFSDNFDRSDADSMGASWTETGDVDIASNQAVFVTGDWGVAAIVHTTALDTTQGYVKVSMVDFAANTYQYALFRYTNSTSPHYYLGVAANCGWSWQRCATLMGTCGEIAAGDAGTCTDGDSFGITWTGTGDDTVVRIFQNPTANTPVSVSEWDTGDSTPELSFTTNPGTPVDSGALVGIASVQSTASVAKIDNFFAGDAP